MCHVYLGVRGPLTTRAASWYMYMYMYMYMYNMCMYVHVVLVIHTPLSSDTDCSSDSPAVHRLTQFRDAGVTRGTASCVQRGRGGIVSLISKYGFMSSTSPPSNDVAACQICGLISCRG